MKVNPNDPAYPIVLPCPTIWHHSLGMTIRLKIASEQMTMAPRIDEDHQRDAKWALASADALIAAYSESQPDEEKDEG